MLRKVVAAFVLGLLLSVSFAALAEDLVLTGTVNPAPAGGTLAVTITPSTVDLSSTAGEVVTKTVQFSNTGSVPAVISLASPTSVSFTGLTPANPDLFNPADSAQANQCTVRFIWDPTNWPANGADFAVANVFGTIKAIRANADFSGPIFTLNPAETRDTLVRFQTNQHLAAATNITGTITFTIQAQ